MDLNRNIYEGWTPQDYINQIRPAFDQRLRGRGFEDKAELVRFVCDEQPYYKKQIPEVISYFWNRFKEMRHARS